MDSVLVTGGSRGIGAECVRLLSEAGYRVFLNYSKSENEALALARETGAVPVRADVSNAAEVAEMARLIKSQCGGLFGLINNAAVAQQKLFTDITEDDWDRMFNVNIKGMYLVTRALVGDMISRKRGRIVNVSSIWGIAGGSCEVHYSDTKGAVIAFTQALAREQGPWGLNVNCIAPGVIDTDMNKSLTPEDLHALADETPLCRIGRPREAAAAAVWLLSEQSSFVTAQVIGADGGLL